jgi:hypothetical protein
MISIDDGKNVNKEKRKNLEKINYYLKTLKKALSSRPA